ncbi:hypothetical protein B7P43_G13490 [Cryptotermes secundus]|uniref:Uncharacterized protein n=1 Tax=Cryptotermes secundus TaxID=105785 RepID=A0A2J7PCV6_9NEOP|nr:hypothetical protein B7P43_G13490 [Cryptotermes secundus]
MKLAANCRKTSRRATVARRWRIAFKKETPQGTFGCQRKEVTATGKKNTEEDKAWKYPECNTGIKDRGLKRRRQVSKQLEDPAKNAIGGCRSGQRSHQEGSICKKTIYEIVSVKIAKGMVGSSVGLRQNKIWTLWRGRPPPKRKRSRAQKRSR